MAIRDEFFIQRQGKKMVLYAGLLEEAHERGLKGIATQLIQVPTPDNGDVAIARAVVEMEEGSTFSGIGDASPKNVGKMIAPHIIRMAETRAKARALRDAVNIGVTSLEEMGEDDDTPQQASQTRTSQPRTSESSPTPFHATEQQLSRIREELSRIGSTPEAFEAQFDVKLDSLPKQRAAKAIEWLSKQEAADAQGNA
jgi:hypothetical protein